MVEVARKTHRFDRNLAFAEALTLTATGNVQFAAADVIYAIGPGRFDGTLIFDVSAIDVASGNEAYTILLQGSNSSSFASGIENLAIRDMGDSSVRLGGVSADSGTGRFEMKFCNNVAGTEYTYVRLRLVIAGTTPTITFSSWIARDSED